jgi:hypothetical protein
MAELVRYRCYCETDDKWESVWQEESEAGITECPVNAAHTIKIGSVSFDRNHGNPPADSSGFQPPEV